MDVACANAAFVAAGSIADRCENFDQANQPPPATMSTPATTSIGRIDTFFFGAAFGAAFFSVVFFAAAGAAVPASGGVSGASYEPDVDGSSSKMSNFSAGGATRSGEHTSELPSH